MMINAIAIDDEPKAIEVIQHLINRIDYLSLIHHFHNSEDAITFLNEQPVDLVFLDINMPEKSGLDLLKEIDRPVNIIFTTAYTEHALESYNYNAIDYLLKPFSFSRFLSAIEKARNKIKSKQLSQPFFFIKDGFKNIKITFKDILFIKGSGNYLEIHTVGKIHISRMTFKNIIEKIPAADFIRTHQSYLVNTQHIDKIENNKIHINTTRIPISEKYKNTLYKKLNLT